MKSILRGIVVLLGIALLLGATMFLIACVFLLVDEWGEPDNWVYIFLLVVFLLIWFLGLYMVRGRWIFLDKIRGQAETATDADKEQSYTVDPTTGSVCYGAAQHVERESVAPSGDDHGATGAEGKEVSTDGTVETGTQQEAIPIVRRWKFESQNGVYPEYVYKNVVSPILTPIIQIVCLIAAFFVIGVTGAANETAAVVFTVLAVVAYVVWAITTGLLYESANPRGKQLYFLTGDNRFWVLDITQPAVQVHLQNTYGLTPYFTPDRVLFRGRDSLALLSRERIYANQVKFIEENALYDQWLQTGEAVTFAHLARINKVTRKGEKATVSAELLISYAGVSKNTQILLHKKNFADYEELLGILEGMQGMLYY